MQVNYLDSLSVLLKHIHSDDCFIKLRVQRLNNLIVQMFLRKRLNKMKMQDLTEQQVMRKTKKCFSNLLFRFSLALLRVSLFAQKFCKESLNLDKPTCIPKVKTVLKI